jgi:hypothetical protein
MPVFWVCWDEDCFDSGEVSVYLSHRKFVVEVYITSETLHQNRCANHSAVVDEQAAVERIDHDFRIVVNPVFCEAGSDEFNSLLTRKARCLSRVVNDDYVKLIHD